MTDSRPWRPDGALMLPSVRRSMEQIVDAWRKRWFVASDFRLKSLGEVKDHKPPTCIDEAHRVELFGATLRASSAGAASLAASILGMRELPQNLAHEDTVVLDALLSVVTSDLLASFPRSDTALGRAVLVFSLSNTNDRSLCTVALDDGMADALMQDALPSPRLARESLARRMDALAATKLQLEMRFGEAGIAMDALQGLAIGDVVVLERMRSAGPELAVIGVAKAFAEVEPTADLGLKFKINRAIG